MRQFWESKTYMLSCLLAACGLMLASCQTRFEKNDKDFGRATQKRLSDSFHQQIAELSQAEKHLPSTGAAPKMPADYSPWWADGVCGKLFESSRPAAYPLDELYVRALQHSSQIRVFSDVPLIRETGIQEARGEFDTHLFAEATYEHVNEPVSTTLKTGVGGPNRFKQWESRVEVGVKKKLATGAEVTLSQELRRTTNNSIYFDPHRQATATLALTVIQPLLRGAGCEYNRARIRIAKFDTEIARNEFVRQAEGHLLSVNRAYWNLYFARATTLQIQKLVKDTAAIVSKLEQRKDIDAMEGELMRAKAALSKRRADLVRAEVAVKNAEDRIKALLNDPTLLPTPQAELLPASMPSIRPIKIDMKQAAVVALENRPEILQSFLQLKASAIRKNVSKNELLPQLDLILSTSLMGLDQAGCLYEGFDNQFKGAHPGFLVGLKFDYPCPNNTAKAVYRRRRLEIRQQLADIQTTVDTVLLEVKISAREVMTAYREVATRYEALKAAEEDVRVLTKRWDSSGGAQKPAVGYLQLLVDAQDRLASAEEEFTRSSVLYNVATISLQRAQGTLLKYEDLEIKRTQDDAGLPVLNISKKPNGRPVAPVAPPAPVTKPAPKPTSAKAIAPVAPTRISAAPAAKPAYRPVATTVAPTTVAGRAAAAAVAKRAMTATALPVMTADSSRTIDRWAEPGK